MDEASASGAEQQQATEIPSQQAPGPLGDRLRISPVSYGIIALVVTFVLYQFIGGVVTFVVVGSAVTEENVDWMRLATMAGQIVLLLGPTLLLLRLQTSRMGDFIRWKRPSVQELFFVLVSVFALQQMLQSYMYLQERIPIPERLEPIVRQLKDLIEQTYRSLVMAHSVPELLFVAVVVAIVPAFAEEILFRGLVQRNFELGLKGMGGVVLTGVVFGFYHFNPFSFVPLAVLGIFFGYIVYRSGSIMNSIAGHFFNNVLAILAVYYGIDEDLLVKGSGTESVGIESVLVNLVLFGGIFIASTYAFIKSTSLKQPMAR